MYDYIMCIYMYICICIYICVCVRVSPNKLPVEHSEEGFVWLLHVASNHPSTGPNDRNHSVSEDVRGADV